MPFRARFASCAATPLFTALASLPLLASSELHAQRPTTIAVDCDAGATIGRALSTAKPGDTVLVSGTCRESVFIQSEQARIVLNGQRKATIQHPGGAAPHGGSIGLASIA